MIDDHIQKSFPTLAEKAKKEGRKFYETVEIEEGRRFWKVLVNNGAQRSVRAFVDKDTGEIFKAASWRAPAKHVRGTIMAEDYGLSCMTPYGPHYLRG